MDFRLADGSGRGYVTKVNSENRAFVDAETNLTGHFVSLVDERAFNFVSEDDDAAAGDYVMYLQNDDTDRLLFIDLVRVCSENAATFKIFAVTGTATGGTALTGVNMNRSSGVSATVTCLGNSAIGGLTTAGLIAPARVAANTCLSIPFDDILILGTGDAVAVEYDTGTTGDCEVLIRCYFRERNL